MAVLQLRTIVVAVLAIFVGINAHPHVFEGHDHHGDEGIRNHRPGAPGPGPKFWVPCNVTETPEPVCFDCHTRLVCTKLGGYLVPCWLPGRHHCDAGQCGSQPSDECAPPPPTTPEPEEPTTEDYEYDVYVK